MNINQNILCFVYAMHNIIIINIMNIFGCRRQCFLKYLHWKQQHVNRLQFRSRFRNWCRRKGGTTASTNRHLFRREKKKNKKIEDKFHLLLMLINGERENEMLKKKMSNRDIVMLDHLSFIWYCVMKSAHILIIISLLWYIFFLYYPTAKAQYASCTVHSVSSMII